MVVLIGMRVWMITKLTMDNCSLEELIVLQYGSFTALSKWVNQLAQRTRNSKHLNEWALSWQLYLDKLDRGHTGWSIAHQQEWGLLLLEWLFYTTFAMQRREQQCDRWKQTLQATAAKDAAPEQPSMWTLLGFRDEDILHLEGSRRHLPWPVSTGPKHLLMSVSRPLDARALWWPTPKAGKGRPLQCYKLRQVSVQGQSMFPWPSMGPLIISCSVTIIRNQQVGRHHSPIAAWMQHYMTQLQGRWTTPAFKTAQWGSSLWSY